MQGSSQASLTPTTSSKFVGRRSQSKKQRMLQERAQNFFSTVKPLSKQQTYVIARAPATRARRTKSYSPSRQRNCFDSGQNILSRRRKTTGAEDVRAFAWGNNSGPKIGDEEMAAVAPTGVFPEDGYVARARREKDRNGHIMSSTASSWSHNYRIGWWNAILKENWQK